MSFDKSGHFSKISKRLTVIINMKSMIKVIDRNMGLSFKHCVGQKENGLIVFVQYKIKKKQMSCNIIAMSYVFLILMVLCYFKKLIILCYPAYDINWPVF